MKRFISNVKNILLKIRVILYILLYITKKLLKIDKEDKDEKEV